MPARGWLPHQAWRGSSRAALALGVILCAGCKEKTGGPRIEPLGIVMELGLAGVVDRTRWNLFRLQVVNHGEDFQGTLTVEGVNPGQDEPVSYRLPLEVPGKGAAVREVAFPVRPVGWDGMRATFRGPGLAYSTTMPIPLDTSALLRVLAVGQGLPDLSALAADIEAGVSRDPALPPEPVEVARLSPAEVPRLAEAYHPFGLVVLWGSTLLEGGQEALAALERWVEAGGTLVAFPGTGWAAGLPPRFAELLGVEAGEPGQGLPEPAARRLGPAFQGGFARELVPRSGVRPLAGGLAFTHPRGAGSVTVFAAAPAGRKFPPPGDEPGLYEALRPALARTLSFSGDPAPGLRAVERLAGGELVELSGFRTPGRGAVLGAIAVYLAVGFFLPALVFRRLGRREWTFAAVLVAAGLFTWSIYRLGLLSAVPGLEVEEVTLLRLYRDGRSAEATSFLGVIAPRPQSFRLELPGSLPQPLRAEMNRMPFETGEALPVARTTLEAEPSGGLKLAPVALYPNGLHLLRFDYRLPVLPSGKGEPPALVKEGTLENRGSSPLGVYLVQGEEAGLLSTLGPGESLPLSPAPRARSTHPIPQVPMPWVDPGRQPLPLPSDSKMETPLLAALRVVAFPREALSSSPQFGPGGAQAPSRFGLRGEMLRLQPRHLVAVSREPVFPVPQAGIVRKAVTVMVLELPPGEEER